MFICVTYISYISMNMLFYSLSLSLSDEGGKSEMLHQRSHTEPSSAAYGTFYVLFWKFLYVHERLAPKMRFSLHMN